MKTIMLAIVLAVLSSCVSFEDVQKFCADHGYPMGSQANATCVAGAYR